MDMSELYSMTLEEMGEHLKGLIKRSELTIVHYFQGELKDGVYQIPNDRG